MFVSSEHGINIQDIKSIDQDVKLLALATPYIVELKKLDIVREIMNDFVGLDNCSSEAKQAVLDFSYNLCLGKTCSGFFQLHDYVDAFLR